MAVTHLSPPEERILELEAALRGLWTALEDRLLVRDTTGDGSYQTFLASSLRIAAVLSAAERALHPVKVLTDDSAAQIRPAWGSLEYQRARYGEEARALKSLCEDHDQIEGETIDALRALFSHSDTETLGEAVVALMETWHCRHQPVEWAIIVSLAKLPKALADHIREEGFEEWPTT